MAKNKTKFGTSLEPSTALVLCTRGSGDHVYIESFLWNAIIAKNVMDNHKKLPYSGEFSLVQIFAYLAKKPTE